MAEQADPQTSRVNSWLGTCVTKAFEPLRAYGFSVVDDLPRGPGPHGLAYTNGPTAIIVGIDPLEGELIVKVARRGHATVNLVDLLDDRTARSLHLQHLPRATSKGVVTSRLTKAVRAIEQQLPHILVQD